jgi:hypothetical protein
VILCRFFPITDKNLTTDKLLTKLLPESAQKGGMRADLALSVPLAKIYLGQVIPEAARVRPDV